MTRDAPSFYDLMFNRGEAHFYAFDLLWLDGEDLRDRPLVERRAALKGLVDGSSILYLDHIQEQGIALFDQCVKLDLEGVVAKPQVSPYRELKGKTTWIKIKIKNPENSQAQARRDLFNAPRRVDERATPQKRRKR